MDAPDALDDCIKSAKTFEKDLKSHREQLGQSHQKLQRIDWMQRQMDHLIVRLRAIAADLEAGFTFREMGFGEDEEVAELLEEVRTQIRDLRGMLQYLACAR